MTIRTRSIIDRRGIAARCSPTPTRLRNCAAWLLAVSVSAASAETDFAQCEAVLTLYEATYVSRYNKLDLEAQRTLVPGEDGGFVLSHSAKRLGNGISERSVMERVDSQLRSSRYDREQHILGAKREQHTLFDWSRGVAENSGRREGVLPLEGQHFDPLNYQLALRCDVARGLEQARYPLVRGGKLKTYSFQRVGAEQLDTALGSLDTIVVERTQDGPERSTRLWFAPGLNYLIVRLRQQDQEDDVDVTLELKAVDFR